MLMHILCLKQSVAFKQFSLHSGTTKNTLYADALLCTNTNKNQQDNYVHIFNYYDSFMETIFLIIRASNIFFDRQFLDILSFADNTT